MSLSDELSQKITTANEVADLMLHVGWEDDVLPRLQRIKRTEQELLTQLVLRSSMSEQYGRTKEEVAGCIYGIDILIGTFNRIIRDGIDAEKAYAQAISASR